MFEVLMGSHRTRGPMRGRGLVSAALHAALIVGGAKATAVARAPDARPARQTDIVLYAPPRRAVVTPSAPAAPPVTASPDSWSGPPPPVAPPNPDRLQSLIPGPPAHAIGLGPIGVDSILLESQVETPASVLVQRAPRYPPALEASGIEGRVVVRFVIDTSGRVEGGSLAIVASAHPGFDPSAREAIERSLFRPARLGRRAVRQWAQQAIVFRIAP
ncbi:MAG: energy transducer TonB [Gemmatimonadales bacterium]